MGSPRISPDESSRLTQIRAVPSWSRDAPPQGRDRKQRRFRPMPSPVSDRSSALGEISCWLETRRAWALPVFMEQRLRFSKLRSGPEAQHRGDLGRRHRRVECERLQLRADGVSDAEHRPSCPRRHDVHGHVRRSELHGGALVLHHRREHPSNRPQQG